MVLQSESKQTTSTWSEQILYKAQPLEPWTSTIISMAVAVIWPSLHVGYSEISIEAKWTTSALLNDINLSFLLRLCFNYVIADLSQSPDSLVEIPILLIQTPSISLLDSAVQRRHTQVSLFRAASDVRSNLILVACCLKELDLLWWDITLIWWWAWEVLPFKICGGGFI